jgi:hypothetical protein
MKKPPIKIEKFMALFPWSEVLRLSMKNIKPANNESDISTEAFSAKDIQTIIDYHEGGPDLEDWIMVGVTHDERFFYLKSGCNYDGWDQRSWGTAKLSHNMSTLYKYAIMEDEKLRFDPVKIYGYIDAEKSLTQALHSHEEKTSDKSKDVKPVNAQPILVKEHILINRTHQNQELSTTHTMTHENANVHYLNKKIA